LVAIKKRPGRLSSIFMASGSLDPPPVQGISLHCKPVKKQWPRVSKCVIGHEKFGGRFLSDLPS